MIRYPGLALDSWLAAYPWIPGQARNDTDSLQSRKFSEARAMIGLLAFDWQSTTIREVGNPFNRDDSTIHFAMHRLRRRLKESKGLQNQLEELHRQ